MQLESIVNLISLRHLIKLEYRETINTKLRFSLATGYSNISLYRLDYIIL